MNRSIWLKGGLPLLILLGAILVAGVMINSRKPPEQKPVETRAFLVEAQPVTREQIEFKVASQGNVVPKNQTSISAQVSGRVMELSDVFVVGGMFNKGDVLITLERDDYVTELKLAAAELAQARAALVEERARGKVAEEEWRSVESVVPPELGLRKPQLAKEQANVQAAEAKLERAQRDLARTEIRAPYNGIVVERSVDVGQFINVGSLLGEIYATDVAEIRLPITDRDLAFIDLSKSVSLGNPVEMSAVVAGKKRTWQGQLVRTEGVMDAGNRLIYAIAQVNDPYLRNDSADGTVPLRFGQFVQASISGTESRQLFRLPRSVLRLDNTVLTVGDDRKLHIQDVVPVRSTASDVYLSDGLQEGEMVVMSAVPNPYEGMSVRLPGDESDIERSVEQDQEDEADTIASSEANP